ncbi:hypothetical protein [Glaciihabitans sp. dw_435]|uniref:hypothetical protein n=1 Tax=Glaciihabitans sp. dw_435 TaxID=2720081 RepID=UPI001BD6491A|nr:hypothetical protein [Glaciihabitans sp. dw_435]
MSVLSSVIDAAVVAVGSTPTPSPSLIPAYTGDPDLISPGILGFLAIFFVAALTVLLLLDMTRRVRRTRYRGEIRERLEAERAAEAADADPEASDR